MIQIKANLADKRNYGGTRSLEAINYIVIHYTANDGDSDENNGKYFHNNYVGASAHYFVDGDSVTRSVPDDYIAWHCGANKYIHPMCRNTNSIGIELCDDRRNGVIYPTPETIAKALKLTEYLMDKFNVPKENVIRHYDVTGKLCPEYWSGNAKNDGLWRSEFWNKLKADETATGETTPTETEKPNTGNSEVKYRVQSGAFTLKKNALAKLKALKAAGFTDAFIVQVGNLWKVQVGAFNRADYARGLVKKLQAAGFSALVVPANGDTVGTIKVGCTVKIKKGAKTFTGEKLKNFVYDRNHVVKSIDGDRVVITFNGIVVAAMNIKDLILQ